MPLPFPVEHENEPTHGEKRRSSGDAMRRLGRLSACGQALQEILATAGGGGVTSWAGGNGWFFSKVLMCSCLYVGLWYLNNMGRALRHDFLGRRNVDQSSQPGLGDLTIEMHTSEHAYHMMRRTSSLNASTLVKS